jgi:hypothetical protein
MSVVDLTDDIKQQQAQMSQTMPAGSVQVLNAWSSGNRTAALPSTLAYQPPSRYASAFGSSYSGLIIMGSNI